jgi:putative membrane protein insertion efficiency factor
MLRKIAVHLIRSYQVWLRCLWPAACRFTPTCSEYAAQAISRYGLLRGAVMAGKRILSCHPYSGKSGFDPIE